MSRLTSIPEKCSSGLRNESTLRETISPCADQFLFHVLGAVGMNVQMQQIGIAGDEQRITVVFQQLFEKILVLLARTEHPFGAVRQSGFVHGFGDSIKSIQVFISPGLFIQNGGAHALEKKVKTQTAGVDHLGFFQLRQHVPGLFQDFPAGDDHFFKYHLVLFTVQCQTLEFFGGVAQHGQDRALLRLGNGFVGLVHGLFHGQAEIGRSDGRMALQRLGETEKKLREDHPGIALGRHQHFRRQPGGQVVQARFVHGIDLLIDRLQGMDQVVAGVAVRHRENIDPVEQFTFLKQDVPCRA